MDRSRAWYDRLLSIDRRWIYVLIAAAVVIPTIWRISVPTGVSSEVRSVYSFVEALQPGDVILLAVDYDPSTLAELHPMTAAILGQAFDRNARVLITCLSQFGPAMAQELIERVAKEHGKTNGVDYVFLGYKPYPAITILAMGSDFRVPFPTDHYGTPLDAIPMMRDIHNYRNVKAVISLAAGNAADFWIQYGNAKFGFPLALGVTGVMASDYYPYLQSGQIFGIIPGMKGAAEYEQLTGRPGAGSQGMPYQVTTHVVILALIVVSNIGYLGQRWARRTAAEKRTS
jgi:hypothetical protein